MENKFIFRPTNAKVNFDAMKLLQLSANEYLFLDLINQFQDKSGTGWAELNKGNNYKRITDFKIDLGNYVGLKERQMYRVFSDMKIAGYIQERQNGFRVSEKFWVLKGEGKIEKNYSSPPSVSEEKDYGKCFYSDSPFFQYDPFREYVNSMFPSDNVDIPHYYQAIKAYYTTENTKAYKNWETKITDWIRRQIKDGDVRRASTTDRTDEQLIQDIRNNYKAVRQVDMFLKFYPFAVKPTEEEKELYREYKKTVEKYISDCNEAKKRKVLPKAAHDDVAIFQNALKNGEIKDVILKSLVSELKQKHVSDG